LKHDGNLAANNRKERLVIFKVDWVGGRARVTIDEVRTCVVTRLNRNQVVEILSLVCCVNFTCKRIKEFIFDTFVYSEPET